MLEFVDPDKAKQLREIASESVNQLNVIGATGPGFCTKFVFERH